mgnify:CR=1 FL=1
MTKLIKTDLAKVTASTRDYCNFKYKKAIGDISFKKLFVSFFSALLMHVALIVLLAFKLTGGLIFWPYWMLQQFLLKRRVIREILSENNTIDEFNQFAKKIESNSKE